MRFWLPYRGIEQEILIPGGYVESIIVSAAEHEAPCPMPHRRLPRTRHPASAAPMPDRSRWSQRRPFVPGTSTPALLVPQLQPHRCSPDKPGLPRYPEKHAASRDRRFSRYAEPGSSGNVVK
jgi:hypothetical protein